MAQVVFRAATKRFGDAVAVDGLDLAVHNGELLVLLGPSGCGKTTALRMVAGLEEPDAGSVEIGGADMAGVEPKDRDVAMVFQSYALYPHMTVAANIEFPLRQRGVGKEERARLVRQTAGALDLDLLLDRKPRQLSGGQRQRVALARAIVRSPQVFLMDEPLSNLDASLRQRTRADIVALQRRLGTTTIYVTHDQVEAMTMGHRIAVMDRGVLQQVDTPEHLYGHPANTVVAGFIGSPPMNLLEATLAGDGAGGVQAVTLGGAVGLGRPAATLVPVPGTALTVGVRAEDLSLVDNGPLAARVVVVEVLGADVHVVCDLDGGARVVVRQAPDAPRPSAGAPVQIAHRPGTVHLFGPDRRRIEMAP
jgi:multiple sugar transport system ATP-binding protein